MSFSVPHPTDAEPKVCRFGSCDGSGVLYDGRDSYPCCCGDRHMLPCAECGGPVYEPNAGFGADGEPMRRVWCSRRCFDAEEGRAAEERETR